MLMKCTLIATFAGFFSLACCNSSSASQPKTGFALLSNARFALQSQVKGKNDTEIDETLFLLYALENLSRKLPVDVNVTNRAAEVPNVVLARFAAYQTLFFDWLRRHAEKNLKNDKELLTVIRSYQRTLDLLGESKELLNKSIAKFNKEMAAASTAASSRVVLNGLGYALSGVAAGDDLDGAILRGLSGAAATYIEEQRKLKSAAAKTADSLNSAIEEIKKKLGPDLHQAQEEFLELLKRYIKARPWTDAQFAFQVAGDKPVHAQNPFLVVEFGGTFLATKSASVEQLLEQADKCRKVADLVPRQAVFDVYRAAFLSMAGLLANRAAAKDLGATGFPASPKDVPDAGPIAFKIWSSYVKIEPPGANSAQVVQQCILACAYAGEYARALNVMVSHVGIAQPAAGKAAPTFKNVKTDFSTRPDFWYDCARVASVCNQLPLAISCLTAARNRGFNDNEVAKISPDLRNVRETAPYATTFKKLFP
jgi:hypothetical protein